MSEPIIPRYTEPIRTSASIAPLRKPRLLFPMERSGNALKFWVYANHATTGELISRRGTVIDGDCMKYLAYTSFEAERMALQEAVKRTLIAMVQAAGGETTGPRPKPPIDPLRPKGVRVVRDPVVPVKKKLEPPRGRKIHPDIV